jgi:hypothetical protein
MGPFGRRAVTCDGVTYTPGSRYRVIDEGAALVGWVPELDGYSGWRQQLRAGDLLTCTGDGPGFGGDPGYGVEFTSPESEAAGAFHCDVQPTAGGVFSSRPAAGMLEPAGAEVDNA